MNSKQPRKKGRLLSSWRLRFSLSSLLVVITLAGVWLGTRVNRARHEKLALTSIREAGALVHFVHQGELREWGTDWNGDKESSVPKWLTRLLGEDFFYQIGSVAFVDSPVDDHHLQPLVNLGALQSLSLQGQSHMGDSHMRWVSRLSNLESLCLWDTGVGDAGLSELTRVKSLTGLGLSRTRISDDGMAELTSFRRLKILELDGTSVTDKAIPYLEQLQTLSSVNLNNTAVTQIGIDRLRKALPKCQILVEPQKDSQAKLRR